MIKDILNLIIKHIFVLTKKKINTERILQLIPFRFLYGLSSLSNRTFRENVHVFRAKYYSDHQSLGHPHLFVLATVPIPRTVVIMINIIFV